MNEFYTNLTIFIAAAVVALIVVELILEVSVIKADKKIEILKLYQLDEDIEKINNKERKALMGALIFVAVMALFALGIIITLFFMFKNTAALLCLAVIAFLFIASMFLIFTDGQGKPEIEISNKQ